MPSKLRNKTARVSFFAFQDMITTVTGVLILVMLLLSLRITQSAFNPRATARDELRQQLEQARLELQARAETLRQRQAELNAMTNRVFVVPELDRAGKQPVLIVLSAGQGSSMRLGQTNRTEFRGLSEFKQVLAGFDSARDWLVFYVRPSGIKAFKDWQCRELAKSRGLTFGYDAAMEGDEHVLINQ